MEKKKIIILTVLLLSCLNCAPVKAEKRHKTPTPVSTFIQNVEMLSTLHENELGKAGMLQMECVECFNATSSSSTGVPIDKRQPFTSEFPYLNLPGANTSSMYCRNLYTYIFQERTLNIRHQIGNTTEAYLPNSKNQKEPQVYETDVTKYCICNNTEYVFKQVFCTVPETDGLITEIRTYPSESSNKAEPISGSDNAVSTEQQFLNLAAKYYTNKDIENAYYTLKRMTELYPNNAYGWYRLACIIYYNDKKMKRFYSNPREVAKKFMEDAGKMSPRLKADCENFLVRFEHPYD